MRKMIRADFFIIVLFVLQN